MCRFKDKSFVMKSGIYHIRVAHFNCMVTLIFITCDDILGVYQIIYLTVG